MFITNKLSLEKIIKGKEIWMRDSIFTIERRIDLIEAYNKFFNDISNITVTINKGCYNARSERFFKYLEYCLKNWPFRMGAIGFEDYFYQINIDFFRAQKDEDILYILELMVNLLYWAPKQERKDSEMSLMLSSSEVETESIRIIENIEYIIEKSCNMKIREKYDDSKNEYYYVISKRDVEVDSVLETAPELSEILLGYYDIRNINDSEYKKRAIEAIYQYLEPNRKKYKGLSCSAISEEFFNSVNTFGIRHNTKSQKMIQNENIYDEIFKMGIYVLQSEKMYQYKEELTNLRNI